MSENVSSGATPAAAGFAVVGQAAEQTGTGGGTATTDATDSAAPTKRPQSRGQNAWPRNATETRDKSRKTFHPGKPEHSAAHQKARDFKNRPKAKLATQTPLYRRLSCNWFAASTLQVRLEKQQQKNNETKTAKWESAAATAENGRARQLDDAWLSKRKWFFSDRDV
ncbi:MAG: hypothetical protein QXX87_02325 [Candidatus Jordarchaeales archaeon]